VSMERIPVHTTGYPRSGNNWVSQMLSDLLDSPIDRGNGLSWFGTKTGPYVLYFHHKTVDQMKGVPGYVVFVYRDPRSVAVSAMFYHPRTLDRVIAAMTENRTGAASQDNEGAYASLVEPWWELKRPKLVSVRYEELCSHPHTALARVLTMLNLEKSKRRLQAVIDRHTFAETYKTACRRANVPVGTPIHALRKGDPADWRNYFDKRTGALIEDKLGGLMLRQGYTDSPDWWQQLPDKALVPGPRS